jgi:hypothetical protein
MAADSKVARDADIDAGEKLGKKYFDTPEMQEILRRRMAFANGLTDPEFAAVRQRGDDEINTAMQTGLRALRSNQAASGIRGGAAGAQALNLLANINSQRQKMANELAIQDIAMRRQGLNDYEGSYTGQRANILGTAMGNAGLGSADRTSAQQYLLGQRFLDQAEKGVGGQGGGGVGSIGSPVENGPLGKLMRGENPFSFGVPVPRTDDWRGNVAASFQK